ncbi:cobalt-precorrin-6A reductase [Rhizobium sp. AN80A]|uniref:cobalt-precorrin-6A reductase n=1 Tax=Rhizobium sp. AN80A TaxID=3040673 RepID=UPI0024B33EC2|nr:cobalt-precorrin-6A reductase [Rhizobium sp. AN80A]
MSKIRILMLGGTTEASALAKALAAQPRYDALLSLAGRTEKPAPQSLPTRIGGFGGAEGLATFLHDGQFDLLIDATHPFAARISQNAAQAAAISSLPAFCLRRAPWQAEAGDNWWHAASVQDAITQLGSVPRRVFLAIGRQEAHRADAAPQHHYLIRSVDPVDPRPVLPHAHYILDRGPFDVERETALLREHGIDIIITKNSGGLATYAKIAAARALGIEVIMIGRAAAPVIPAVATVDEALAMINHLLPPG